MSDQHPDPGVPEPDDVDAADLDDGDDAGAECRDIDSEYVDLLDAAVGAEADDDDAETEPAATVTIDEFNAVAIDRDGMRALAQRVQAEFDNYRKRTAAQLSAEIERATGNFAQSLLPVLDAAEAAYLRHPDEIGPLLNLLLCELKKHGLESIDLLDQPFDPNLAEAVAHEPGGDGEPVVAEVLRSGYTWNGRTLRPAMVRTRD